MCEHYEKQLEQHDRKLSRSKMIKEILQLQKELGIKRSANYYFCFSNSKLKFVISSFQDEIEDKEDNQDYRMYRAV